MTTVDLIALGVTWLLVIAAALIGVLLAGAFLVPMVGAQITIGVILVLALLGVALGIRAWGVSRRVSHASGIGGFGSQPAEAHAPALQGLTPPPVPVQ